MDSITLNSTSNQCLCVPTKHGVPIQSCISIFHHCKAQTIGLWVESMLDHVVAKFGVSIVTRHYMFVTCILRGPIFRFACAQNRGKHMILPSVWLWIWNCQRQFNPNSNAVNACRSTMESEHLQSVGVLMIFIFRGKQILLIQSILTWPTYGEPPQ